LTVSTVLHPEATRHEISLQECIALALEKGRVNGTSLRVLAYEPAIAYTAIDESLARFDTRWFSAMGWSQLDERVGNIFSAIPLGLVPTAVPTATGTGVSSGVGTASVGTVANMEGFPFNNVAGAAFETKLEKLLPTGGVAGITFSTDYTLVNQPPVDPGTFNPTYRPRLTFSLDQPLLRGFGATINHVPIVIARIGFDQEREKFAGAVDQLLLSVEQAYWDLYFSYWNLYTQEGALRQAHDAWQIAKQLQEKKLVAVQDLAALELQYQTLRLGRLEALGGPGVSVLEAERRLRFVIGLPPEDGTRLIPTDTPTTARYVPDWQASLTAALENRPDLAQVRQEIKKIQLEIKKIRNDTLPDLRAVGTYDINGAGNRLDGPGDNNALRDLASDHFNDWTIGLTLDVPIGFRAANSQLRRAQLRLAQRTAQLRDMEKQVAFALQQTYRDLVRAYEAVSIEASIRQAATQRYQALYDLFRAGLEGPNFLLIAQQEWIRASTAERSSIFAYNTAIAKFELEKGTIQQFDSVSISDAPLPACVQGRASAHINERQRALVLREVSHCAHAALDGCNGSCAATQAAPPTIARLPVEQSLNAAAGESSAPVSTYLPVANAPPAQERRVILEAPQAEFAGTN
jgi:outer membrane protein TolC